MKCIIEITFKHDNAIDLGFCYVLNSKHLAHPQKIERGARGATGTYIGFALPLC